MEDHLLDFAKIFAKICLMEDCPSLDMYSTHYNLGVKADIVEQG